MLGTVKKINVKTGTSTRGKWALYSMVVGHDDGSESGWISLGFDAPSFGEGQYCDYTTETTSKGVNLVSFKKLEKPAGSTPPPSSKGYVDRNDSIVYQSSRKDAISLVGLLLEHDGLPMVTSGAKAGQAKRYEEITAFVDKLTVEFFNDVQSGRLFQQVVDSGSTPAPTAAHAASGATEDND